MRMLKEAMNMGTNGGAASGTATINGAAIYYEVRGEGVPVLFIPGANDATSFRPVAEALADTFTVVTFDLRGTSHSPPPKGWTQTSVGELAEDAAGLVSHLGFAPVVVFGASAGGAIAIELVLRHPELVRGVVVHDPFILAFLGDQLPAVMAQLQKDVGKGMAAGGPRVAMDGFYRSFVGDAVWEGLDDESRQRLLANGEVMFDVLLGAFASYQPDEAGLVSLTRPVRVLLGRDTLVPFLAGIGHRLAQLTKGETVTVSGGHNPFFDRPDQMASELRPHLLDAAAP